MEIINTVVQTQVRFTVNTGDNKVKQVADALYYDPAVYNNLSQVEKEKHIKDRAEKYIKDVKETPEKPAQTKQDLLDEIAALDNEKNAHAEYIATIKKSLQKRIDEEFPN